MSDVDRWHFAPWALLALATDRRRPAHSGPIRLCDGRLVATVTGCWSTTRGPASAATPRELYAELRARHGFSLSADSLKVAVNERFGDWQQALVDGDTVVFVPPVAGG